MVSIGCPAPDRDHEVARNPSIILAADPEPTGRSALHAVAGVLGCALEIVDTGAEALAVAQLRQLDLVLLAADLAEPSAYEVLRQLRVEFGPGLPIAFLSAVHHQERDEVAALLLGADEYLAKPLVTDRWTARLHRLIMRTDAPHSPAATHDRTAVRLTNRERQVLGLLVGGMLPVEIAEALCITRKTAASHIEHILAKLGAHTQAQAVAFALRDDVLGSAGSAA
jgi:DNA-binding NarL/FixJ family response regulator